jgi:hypothetical protein
VFAERVLELRRRYHVAVEHPVKLAHTGNRERALYASVEPVLAKAVPLRFVYGLLLIEQAGSD